MEKDAEQTWIKRALQGEPDAIAELYRYYWRAARATAYGATADLVLAEDVASEALGTAFQSMKNLKDMQCFGPWLHTIVVRTAKRHQTKNLTQSVFDIQALPDIQSLSPDAGLEQRELIALIHEAVGALSKTLREAISFFYFEGYTVDEAAHFLDIPVGTFKRRLHDGRCRLRDAGEQILKGRKPKNIIREQVLQQFKILIEQGPDHKDFHYVIRQVLRLRPLPYELIAKFLQQHSKIAKKMATPKGREEVEQRSRRIMEYICRPSSRVLDPNHIVSQIAQAIRTALPEFHEWKIDASLAARNLIQKFTGNIAHSYQPPGFAEGIPGSYIYSAKGLLIQNQDGSVVSPYEHLQDEDVPQKKNSTSKSNQVISDTLVLSWMRSNTIELQEVETLLRRLSEMIAPKVSIHFFACEAPLYRSALRMQFENIPIPAATGGPVISCPNIPDAFSTANIQIFLEPWATAQTGRPVELIEMTSLLGIFNESKEPNN